MSRSRKPRLTPEERYRLARHYALGLPLPPRWQRLRGVLATRALAELRATYHTFCQDLGFGPEVFALPQAVRRRIRKYLHRRYVRKGDYPPVQRESTATRLGKLAGVRMVQRILRRYGIIGPGGIYGVDPGRDRPPPRPPRAGAERLGDGRRPRRVLWDPGHGP